MVCSFARDHGRDRYSFLVKVQVLACLETSIPPEGVIDLEKERQLKDDGRYIIFYHFEDEDEERAEEEREEE